MAFDTSIFLDWGKTDQEEFSISCHSSSTWEEGFLETHWHDCFEIILMEEGRRTVTTGNASFSLEPGDVLLLPPRVPHGSPGGIFTSTIFGYANSLIYTGENSLSSFRFLLPFRRHSAHLLQGDSILMRRLRRLIHRGSNIFNSDSPVRVLELRACILRVHGILWQLCFENQASADSSVHYLMEAQAYIEAHLAEDISPYEIAGHLHISHSHLCRIIRNSVCQTPTELIKQYRLFAAERLLTAFPEMSIGEVASRCGFSDSSYFTRCFRNTSGITPREYRKLAVTNLNPQKDRHRP